MILQGRKTHAYHACMSMHELGSRLNMRKKPDRADFECLQDFGSAKRGEIRAVSWT